MRRLVAVASLFVCCVVIASAAQPPAAVRVDVIAANKDGKPVTNLTAADFEILSDGQPAPIIAFAGGRSPLTVVILVDITASLWPNPEGVAGIPSTAAPMPTILTTAAAKSAGIIPLAVEEFPLKGLNASDRVRVGAITRRPQMGDIVAGNSKELEAQWKALFDKPPVEWLGPSPIFDATRDAVLWSAQEPGRRAVILMSDGQGSGNVRGHADVATDAVLAGVSINTVAELGAPQATAMLRAMADATGGWHIHNPYSKFSTRTGPVEKILDLLHQSYTLGFTPVRDSKPHAIDVRVKKPGITVRARRGYVATGGT